jgi:cytochrome c553
MRRAFRWIGIACAAVVALAIAGYALVYALSERILDRKYPVPFSALTIPTDAPSLQEGHRLAIVHSCLRDCHGKAGEGRVMFDDPKIAKVVAPNLPAAVQRYSDSQLAAIIRNGVRPDGRSLVIMPAEAFVAMSDEDVARLIGFLRSMPPLPGPGPHVALGPLGRIGVVAGKFQTAAQRIAASRAPAEATTPEQQLGRYLARTVCAECHGTDLHGDANPDFTSPDLAVVAAYTPETFTGLLRTGTALGGRQVGMMSEQARNNLSQLTDAEIAALYSYLHGLPAAHAAPRPAAAAAAAPQPYIERLEAALLLQSLNAALLSHDSATLTLQGWCDAHHLASPARISAERVYGLEQPPTQAQREQLQVKPTDEVRHRKVRLLCGAAVLSEADNWYVPARLTPEMNRLLDTTDTPFGRAVQALHFQRHTLSADLLWQPLPPGWELESPMAPQAAGELCFPPHVLQHRALLALPDGTPISEVIETYSSNLLAVPRFAHARRC